MKTTTDGQTKRLSAKIARCLFTDGSGKRAQRLVMEHNGALGAGWVEAAMADRIAELLHAWKKRVDDSLE